MDLSKVLETSDNQHDLFKTVLSDELASTSNTNKADHVEKTVITAINTKLEVRATHCQGLDLLFQFSSKISHENLKNNFSNWIKKVKVILENAPGNSQELIMVCRSIGALITSCKQVPELDKEVSTRAIKDVVSLVYSRHVEDKHEALLNLLIVMLYQYPESCAHFRTSFSEMVSDCIDEKDKNLINSGAKCYSLLVRAIERVFIRSTKESFLLIPDNSHANCHIFHQTSLCNDLDGLMDDLFQNFVTPSSDLPDELKETKTKFDTFELEEIPYGDDYYTRIENRFSNICTYLAALIKIGGSGGKKYVLPNVILRVISKGLAVTPINLEKNDSHNKKPFLLLILPKLYAGLLKVLRALITSFRQELLSNAVSIQRLILQTLEATTQSYHKSLKKVRIFAYKTLSLWLRLTGSSSGFHMLADEFLPHILKDISLPNNNVLVLTAKAGKNNLKTDQNSNNSHNTDHLCNNTDLVLCSQVLLTVQTIISSVNVFLKESFYDRIKNLVVLLLYEEYVKNSSILNDETSTKFRLQLVKTLRVLQVYTHISTPSPISYTIQLFGIIISQESNSEIIDEANLGLAELRHVVNPSAPTLAMLPKPTNLCSSESASPLQLNNIIKPRAETVISGHLQLNNIIKHPRAETITSGQLFESGALIEQVKQQRIEENTSCIKSIFTNVDNYSLAGPAKRPRIDNTVCIDNPLLNATMVKSKKIISAISTDEEMMMSFCNLPSAT